MTIRHFSINQQKNKQEAYDKLVEMSRGNDYTTRNLLGYFYHQNYYKHMGIDLSRQRKTSTSQEINCTEKLEEDDGVKMFL